MSGFNPNYANSTNYNLLLQRFLDRITQMEKKQINLEAENKELKIKYNNLEKQLKSINAQFLDVDGDLQTAQKNFLTIKKALNGS